jgi:tetratricopeptide (TPR) repeat protein
MRIFMKKIIALIVFIALLAVKAFSCANYYFTLNKEGKVNPMLFNTWEKIFDKNFNPQLNVTKLKKLEVRLKKEHNYMLLSDYGVCLMKLGKEKEALAIFIELYKHYPNDYKIAANLGTAYELSGQVDSALKYIQRDIQLNPNDHEGSEWIHVKVLQAKQQLAKNPDYLKDHTVLGLTDKQKNDSAVLQQLFIQLRERVPFTPEGHNEIMVSLFTDLGDLSANLRSIEFARDFYQVAKNYYGGSPDILDGKIEEMQKLKKKYAYKEPPKNDKLGEGMQHMMSSVNYTQMLSDNNEDHFLVSWSKINTDVPSLLAMVDFSITAMAAADSAAHHEKKGQDELKIVVDKSVLKAGRALDTPPKLGDASTIEFRLGDSARQVPETAKLQSIYTVEGAPAKPAPLNYGWVYIAGILALVGAGYLVFTKMKSK